MKINTDGPCTENPGLRSYGFYLRDCRDDIVYVEADTIGLATNIMIEATVVLRALQFGNRNNYHDILLESDSLSML